MFRLGFIPLIGFFFLISCQSDSNFIKAEKRDWIESIYASSKVQALNQYAHHSDVTGRLMQYYVKEGDTVEAGDLIAEIDGVNSETRLKIAKSQREQALSSKSRIDELHYQIIISKNALIQDSTDFFRQKRLYKSGVGNKVQLEQRELKYAQTQAQLASLQKRYQSLQNEINAQLKQSEQNVELAKNQLNSYRIYALRKGRVYELRGIEGELISPQQPIALIGDSEQFLVEMEIDERDISKIELAQEVIVKLDAYPNTFKAKLSSISPHLDAQTQTFHAEAIFTSSHPKFYPGLTAESNIILQKKSQVLVVPASVLIDENTIETSQGKKTIAVGLRNSQFVEVVSGIDENTEIIVPK